MRQLVAGGLLLGLVSVPVSADATVLAAKVAAPALSVTTKAATVSESSRIAKVAVKCDSSKTCRGTLAIRVGSKTSAKKKYAVKAKKSKTYSIRLTGSQRAMISRGGSKKAYVRVTESAPKKVSTRSVGITLKRTAAPQPTPKPTTPKPTTPPGPALSKAYTERNWKPTAVDTCPVSLHNTHSVVGADGKLYPTWHPATDLDPATGKSCTYGHEHGDDPATSDIYEWVTDFIDEDSSKSRGVPFGYVSEVLDTYSASKNSLVTRHEDNAGHKVIVANDVSVVAKSPRAVVKDKDGKAIKCDYLIKFHQGSHSSDATKNNAHETIYAINCSDGTELISSTFTRYGNANEFDRSCDRQKVATTGSILPDGFGGRRLIPDMTCVNSDVLVPEDEQSDVWSLYEVWESANRIQTADGTQLASFDPWFGVRNPSRVYASGFLGDVLALVDTLYLVDGSDGGTAKGHPWSEHADEHSGDNSGEHTDHLTKTDPASPFDGAQRDYYLQGTTVANAAGPAVWWTDPYGDNAVTAAGNGLVKQWISNSDNTGWPELERRTFDLEKDYGNGNGVHAPN